MAKNKPVTKSKIASVEEQAVIDAKKKAQAAKAEAAKLLKSAEAQAAKLKREAAKKAEKEKAEAKAEKEKGKVLTKLKTNAKEINVRMDKAAKLMGDADDHRLAAALNMAIAKEECREIKMPFKDWCDAEIKLGHESIRKLLPIGAAEHAEKGAGKLMLSDLRNKTKQAVEKHREKKKASRTSDPKAPAKSAWERAKTAFNSMNDKERDAMLRSQADGMDLEVVERGADQSAFKEAPASSTPRKDGDAAFRAMAQKAKVAFVTSCAYHLGFKLVAMTDEEKLEIPAHIRR